MNRAFAALRARSCAIVLAATATAAAGAAVTSAPTAAEKPFVRELARDLPARFPRIVDAERAGYLRYTSEDESGAISYANRHWFSADARHPSQLWYDARGRLIGADFSVPYTGQPGPPHRFGVDPRRWIVFRGPHHHFGVRRPDGSIAYGGIAAVGRRAFGKYERVSGTIVAAEIPAARRAAVLRDLRHGSVRAVVDAGYAARPSDVTFFFEFPALWDLVVWVVPNPSGAFAEKNPNVVPVHPRRMPSL